MQKNASIVHPFIFPLVALNACSASELSDPLPPECHPYHVDGQGWGLCHQPRRRRKRSSASITRANTHMSIFSFRSEVILGTNLATVEADTVSRRDVMTVKVQRRTRCPAGMSRRLS